MIDKLKFFKKNIRKLYSDKGIYAGLNHFKEYWSRDSMWASFGALELKDYKIVKNNLKLFFENEQKGFLPIRIGNKNIIQSFLKIKSKKLHSHYFDDKSKNFCSDSIILPIIVLCIYTTKTNDFSLFNKYQNKIESLYNNLKKYIKNDFIEEGYYSTWMDSTKKSGNIFYSNLLYYISVEKFYTLCKKAKVKGYFTQKYVKNLKENINKKFWIGNYFQDWFGNNDNKYFDTYSNLLSIYFDFASKEQKKKIFNFIDTNSIYLKNGFIKKTYPKYSKKYVSKITLFLGLDSYVFDIYYPWMSFMYFICLIKENKLTQSKKNQLELFLNNIYESKTIYECYNKKFKPFKELLYKSEEPFAWAISFGIILLKKLMKK
jgi:hypothetical protein